MALKNNPNKKVILFEKGKSIEKRICPKRKTGKCIGCNPCSITTGFAGAGAYSDGKLSLSTDVGGNLPEYIGYDRTRELIKYVDDIYLSFGTKNKVLVQRYEDFKRGRRTTEDKLYRNNIVPTLKDAVPGDLSLVLPYRLMKDIDDKWTGN